MKADSRPNRGRSAERWLKELSTRIAEQTHPEKILLFGSFAYGKPGKDSDLDLLVVLRKPKRRDLRYALVERAIGEHLWPIDLLVRTPEELKSRLSIGDTFFMDILRDGRVLYES